MINERGGNSKVHNSHSKVSSGDTKTKPDKKPATRIQAILFDKDKYTNAQANAWLKKNGYNKIKPLHVTDNYRRARLVEPTGREHYRTKKINNDIKMIVELLGKKKRIKKSSMYYNK